MDKSRYRLTLILGALAAVLAIALCLQFRVEAGSAALEQQGDETAATSEAPERSALDESPDPPLSASAGNNGLFSSVEWRNRSGQSPETYPRTYSELRALAEQGDAEATRRLIGLLEGCQYAALPLSDDELSAIVTRIRESYSMPTLRGGQFEFLPETTGDLGYLFGSAEELDAFVDKWHANTKTCTVVTVEQRSEVDYWHSLLEEQGGGPFVSQRTFHEMERDEQVAHIDARWATGDPYALAQYAAFYADNNQELFDPSARIKSYAYIYAYYEAAVDRMNSIPVFGVELAGGAVTLSAEHQAYRWCPVEEAAGRLLWEQQRQGLLAFHDMLTVTPEKLRWMEVDVRGSQ